jgi:hypothetical protein
VIKQAKEEEDESKEVLDEVEEQKPSQNHPKFPNIGQKIQHKRLVNNFQDHGHLEVGTAHTHIYIFILNFKCFNISILIMFIY